MLLPSIACPLLVAALVPNARTPQDSGEPRELRDQPHVLMDWLVVNPPASRSSSPFGTDRVFHRYLLSSMASRPAEGEVVGGPTRSHAWRRVRADAGGRVEGPIGYAYTSFKAETTEVWMADLDGAERLFVNGEGFIGDPDRRGYDGVPVLLKEGSNLLFVAGAPEGFTLSLRRPSADVMIERESLVVPDYVPGYSILSDYFGVTCWNASSEWIDTLHGHYGEMTSTPELVRVDEFSCGGTVAPLAPAQWSNFMDMGMWAPGIGETGYQPLQLLGSWDDPEFKRWKADIAVPVRGRSASEPHSRTYYSSVDGSLHSIAAVAPEGFDEKPAIRWAGAGVAPRRVVLTLPDEGMDVHEHLASFPRREDFWLVAPMRHSSRTFRWRDWSRWDLHRILDELTAWRAGSRKDPFDDSRPKGFLHGHGSGAESALRLALLDPDAFAVLAVDGGWGVTPRLLASEEPSSSFWSVGRVEPLGLQGNLKRLPTVALPRPLSADGEALRLPAPSSRLEDWLQAVGSSVDWEGVDTDPTVADPASILDALREEEPGLLKPVSVDWTGIDPGVDCEYSIFRVDQVQRYGEPFRLTSSLDLPRSDLLVETQNVRRLGIDAKTRLKVIDGQSFGKEALFFQRDRDGRWTELADDPLPAGTKHPQRSGPFLRAFDNSFLLVYGTAGNEEEDVALLARARYDLESWWYRFQGTPELVSDEDFLARLVEPEDFDSSDEWDYWEYEAELEFIEATKSRNLILYGNEDTNRAWSVVLSEECPIRARRGEIQLGDQKAPGNDLTAMFVYPSALSDESLVGAFADTGVAGSRLGYALELFDSELGYPDYTLLSSEFLTTTDAGILAAGWFDHLWQLTSDDLTGSEEEPK